MAVPEKSLDLWQSLDDVQPLLGWAQKPADHPFPRKTGRSVLAGGLRVIFTMLLAGTLFVLTTYLSFRESKAVVSALDCWRNTTCRGPAKPTWPGPWEKYNYSPSSRTVSPQSVYSLDFQLLSTFPGIASLNAQRSSVIFDFGKEVGGIVTITYNARGSGMLGLAFSEARNWTGEWSDSSNGSFRPDGAVLGTIIPGRRNKFTVPDSKTRGGFRYLTVFGKSESKNLDVEIIDVSLEISFQPDWPNLRAYRGYFSSSDDLLNKAWYSGAYTLQTNAVPPSQGRAFPIIGGGWLNEMNLNMGSNEPVIYVDGSKRDRTVWAGDLAIAVPSILVSLGDWDGVRNTLQVMYNDQLWSGELPFAGPAINIYNSDTYHCATLIGTYDYFIFTNDKNFMWGIWRKYKLAMSYIIAKIDSTGMLFVTGRDDWGRMNQGGHNTEANMMMYRALTTASAIAEWMGDPSLSSYWATIAATLRDAINEVNFDTRIGAFKDSDIDGSIHPQDGNSMSLLFSLANPNTTSSISRQLTRNWNSIGSVSPELPGTIVGFIQSFEIKAHLSIGQTLRGLNLIRRSWGWYLNNPYGTQSTCIEGYLADGTFGYRSTTGYAGDYSYTSHAHGWSTGPTDALTSYVVGLRLVKPAGREWMFEPQFGDLTFAEAGFTTPIGRFFARWWLTREGYAVEWAAPPGTKGKVYLPSDEGKEPRVVVVGGKDEAVVMGAFDEDIGKLVVTSTGGTHSVRVAF